MTVRTIWPNTVYEDDGTTVKHVAYDIVTSGPHQFIEGQAQVAQDINTRLSLFRGEWFRDLLEGTGWFQFILGQTNLSEPESEIKRRILGTPNVDFIVQYRSDLNKRTRSYVADVSVTTPFSRKPISIRVQPNSRNFGTP